MHAMKKAGATIALTSSLLLAGGALAGPASAQNNQDGLVNVNVGDVTVLENVAIGVSAQLIAQVCGVRVGPIAVLGAAVDASNNPTGPICTGTISGNSGPITITQN